MCRVQGIRHGPLQSLQCERQDPILVRQLRRRWQRQEDNSDRWQDPSRFQILLFVWWPGEEVAELHGVRRGRQGHLPGLFRQQDLLALPAQEMKGASHLPVALLAGGLATRLRPITEKIPKVLVSVAGKPFLEHQLALLRQQGLTRVVLCLGHLGEMVADQFGDGRAHGMQIEYSFDGPKLLGTGGALRQALPKLGDNFFVLYGDSYLTEPFVPVAEFFLRSGRPGLMTVFRNEGKYDTSNVVFRDGEIILYDKKQRLPEMRHIDYGLSIFNARVFDEWPADEAFDLAQVMTRLVERRQMAGWEVKERFHEIGSHAGLEELNRLLSR
jgi:dTDP-glucose pyrophosphorylase